MQQEVFELDETEVVNLNNKVDCICGVTTPTSNISLPERLTKELTNGSRCDFTIK